MDVVDFAPNATFLKAPTEASMNALNPALMQNVQHGGSIAGSVVAGYFFVMGMFTPQVYWLTFVESFVSLWLGTYVGGMLYREEGEASAMAEAAVMA